MNILKATIHQIYKEMNTREATATYSSTCLPVDNTLISFHERLSEVFDTQGKSWGVFRSLDGFFFPVKFREFLASAQDEENFLKFTKDTAENLKGKIKEIGFAKGGFLKFVETENGTGRFLTVFFLRDTPDFMFIRDERTKNFLLNETKHLVINKLAMACRINISRFGDADARYLSFVKDNQQKDVSQYFYDWFGTNILDSDQQSSKDFVTHVVESIPRPRNPETRQTYTVEEFKEITHDYLKSLHQRKTPLNINDFSERFFNQRNRVSNFLERNGVELNGEFNFDEDTRRKLYQFYINADGVRLRFSLGDWNSNKVRLAIDRQDQVIIESRTFADAVRTQTRRADRQ